MLSFALSSTFALTSIYSKFMFNDQQLQINKQDIEDVNKKHTDELQELKVTMYKKFSSTEDEINGRIDRKGDRMNAAIKELEKRNTELQKAVLLLEQEVKYLQRPNSDK